METNYSEFIQNILDTRGRFACGDEYHERHHIVPKCMDGTDDEDNLIDLYAREHFIAHKLLAQENPENDSLTYAWGCMAFPSNSGQNRYELAPEEYEEARIALSEAKKGKPRSEETKRKVSEKAKERYKDPEFCAKMKQVAKDRCTVEVRRRMSERMKGVVSGENNPMFGRRHTEETRRLQSQLKQGMYDGDKNPFYGKKHTEETKEKLRELSSGKWTGENNPFYGSCRTRGAGPNARKVIRISDSKIYDCILDAADDNGVHRKTITRHCKQHVDFMYYDEWLTQQNK